MMGMKKMNINILRRFGRLSIHMSELMQVMGILLIFFSLIFIPMAGGVFLSSIYLESTPKTLSDEEGKGLMFLSGIAHMIITLLFYGWWVMG